MIGLIRRQMCRRPSSLHGRLLFGVSEKLGALFGSPYDEDHRIWGSILGPLLLETPTCRPFRPVGLGMLGSGCIPRSSKTLVNYLLYKEG